MIFTRRHHKRMKPTAIATEVAPAAHIEEHAERSHAEIKVIIGALMLAMLLAALDQTIVSTALPKIASDLNGFSKYSWVATAYLLTSAVSTPLYGKISDMFGRKRIFQAAIVIFLLGSILCGAAQTMNQLIIFRGIQGIGAGGLITLVFSIIADIIPMRQRGRYQGYFTAVFGLSSVAGPLLGGLFTDHLSWRWVFYINVPLGILALTAIALRLHLPVRTSKHKIDFAGAILLAVAVASLLLATVWGGIDYPWKSIQIIGLFATSAIGTALFVWRERYAAEPIISLSLFKNPVFSVSVLLSFIIGIVMFGALIFLPQYQQVVRGDTATKSGLMMIPFMAGMLTSSLTTGRLVSKFGKYRKFPIMGSSVVILAFWLFSHIAIDTNRVVLGLWMALLGAGIGMVMPVMTLAVQNSVERKNLGSATSSVIFFRNIGSSLGAAIFGTVLTNRLAHHLMDTLPANGRAIAADLAKNTHSLLQLPGGMLHTVLVAFASSFHDVFLFGVPFAVAAFVVALFLRESPLKESTKEMAEGEALRPEH